MAAPRVFDPLPLGKWPGPAVAAIKALGKGEARPDQQAMALNFILDMLCDLYGEQFRAEGDRETSFALGRAWVGRQIRTCLTQPFEALVGKPAKPSSKEQG